jgi:hypothetical protein
VEATLAELEEQVAQSRRLYEQAVVSSKEISAAAVRNREIKQKVASLAAQADGYREAMIAASEAASTANEVEQSTLQVSQEINEFQRNVLPALLQDFRSETSGAVSTLMQAAQKGFETMHVFVGEAQAAVAEYAESASKDEAVIKQALEDSEQALAAQAATLDERLASLEAAVGTLREEIQAIAPADVGEESDLERASGARLRELADAYARQREEEWTAFDAANERAQRIIDETVANAAGAIAKAKLMERLAAAEERAKWCARRVTAWSAEGEQRKKLGVEEKTLWRILEEFEQTVVAVEATMAKMDGNGEPKKFGSYAPVKLKGETPPPPASNGTAPLLEFPADLKLTYGDGEEPPDFVGLPH